MKKTIPILIVGVLLISGLGAVATPDGDVEQVTKSLFFSQLSINERDDRIILELEGTNSVFMKKDHYMLPSRIETFTFPLGTKIKSIVCTPKNIQRQTLTKELMVTPDPVLAGFAVSQESKEIIPKSPGEWYEFDVGTGLIDGYTRGTIVKLQLLPIQYDQSQQLIEWANIIEVSIDYVLPEDPLSFEDEYIFAILAPDSFTDELDDLLQHKISRGISTILVSLNDIYNGVYFPATGRDNQEKIKYFIKNAIENWNTYNVLLVGGSSQLPTRGTHIHVDANPPDNEVFVSDLYYADIYNETFDFASWDTNENDVFGEYDWGSEHNFDEVDLYPDVYLGRLACVSANEVTTTVNKITTYETNEAYTQNWFTNLVVIGGDSFPGDAQSVDEGEYVNEEVIDIMDGFIPDRVWASNGRLDRLVPTGVQEINGAIGEGVGFVDFSGHGNTYVWATHPHEDQGTWLPTPIGYYLNSHVLDLDNGDELPIVVTGACSVGKFNADPDCFSWSFLINQNGGGIASLGATGLGWAYIGQGVTQGLIEGICINTFEAYCNEGATTFGEMWGKAINEYIHPGMDNADYKTLEEWEPFGDPTLAIAEESLPPDKPERPDGPTDGKINVEYTYTTSTTEPDGDQVYYLFEWGDGTYSGWVGPYAPGETGEASHKWTEQGSFQIRVKAKDEHGVQSVWSDPLPVNMPVKNGFFHSILLEIFEWLMDRFPILEQIISSKLILGRLLGL